MRCFLIDYENVDTPGLDGLSKLKKGDRVYIFYSEKHSRLSFGLHRRIIEAEKRGVFFEYHKTTSNKKNALDDELISELENILPEDSRASYYIVSKDKGYKKAINGWNKKRYDVNLFSNISEGNMDKKAEFKNKIKSRLVEDEHISFDLSDKEITDIANFIMSCDNKTQLNECLQSMFYSKDVKYIFTRLKDITYDM